MQTVTISELEWIHDCALLNIVYDLSNNKDRTIQWTMRCPEDLGYAPWEGKELVLIASDVAMFRLIAWRISGEDTISAIRPGISDDAQESTMEAREMGIRFPDLEFTVEMHSGSYVEVICSKLEIRVNEIQQKQ